MSHFVFNRESLELYFKFSSLDVDTICAADVRESGCGRLCNRVHNHAISLQKNIASIEASIVKFEQKQEK